MRVGRDASLFDLKKAIAAKAGLLLKGPAKPGEESDSDDEDSDDEDSAEHQDDRKEAPVYPGDITDPPPSPAPASHEIKGKWRPKVLDFGLGIVGAGGRQFFLYALEAVEKEVGGLAKVLGLPARSSDDKEEEETACRRAITSFLFVSEPRSVARDSPTS